MSNVPPSPVSIRASPESLPSVPAWFGEVTLIAWHLEQQGVLSAVSEKVRFARRRFGHYEVIDFFGVVLGYAGSLLQTAEALWECVHGLVRTGSFATPPRSVAFCRPLTRPALRGCAGCL